MPWTACRDYRTSRLSQGFARLDTRRPPGTSQGVPREYSRASRTNLNSPPTGALESRRQNRESKPDSWPPAPRHWWCTGPPNRSGSNTHRSWADFANWVSPSTPCIIPNSSTKLRMVGDAVATALPMMPYQHGNGGSFGDSFSNPCFLINIA